MSKKIKNRGEEGFSSMQPQKGNSTRAKIVLLTIYNSYLTYLFVDDEFLFWSEND